MSKVKWGRVDVTKAFLKEYPNFIERHMPEFIVHSIIPKDQYTDIYYGTHPEFKEIDVQTEVIPFYMFYFGKDDNGNIFPHKVEEDILNDEDAVK